MSLLADTIQVLENDAFVALTKYLGLDSALFLKLLAQAGQVEDRSLNARGNEMSPRFAVGILAYTLYEKLTLEITERVNLSLGAQNHMLPVPKKTTVYATSPQSQNELSTPSFTLIEAPSPSLTTGQATVGFDALHINYINERFILSFTESLSVTEKVCSKDRVRGRRSRKVLS